MTFAEQAVQLAGYAASLLEWRPSEFWDSTPAELVCALGLDPAADEQMDRGEMERLLRLFPDQREK